MRGADHGPWRRYPPLGGVFVAIAMALLLLPSALRFPPANPTQTLEFAPVPDEQEPGAPGGSIGALGPARAPPGPTPPDPAPPRSTQPHPVVPGEAERPVTKRCVGHPPRQSEDPLSPPCVAHFDGDNGGATHRGVTPVEVRVVVYFDGGAGRGPTSRGAETMPVDRIFDLGQPPGPEDEPVDVRLLRGYQRHFNERYQTYGRFVRFIVHYSQQQPPPTSYTEEIRVTDLERIVAEHDPFAVISYAGPFGDTYVRAAAEAGLVTILGSLTFRAAQQIGEPADFYRSHAGLIWSHEPSRDERVRLFAGALCRRVVGHAVSFSGNGDRGADRRIGLLRVDAPGWPNLTEFGKEVGAAVEACGGEIVAEGITAQNLQACDSVNAGPAAGQGIFARAVANMNEFQAAGVTTIVWAGGNDTCQSQAASLAEYFPEWVLAPDGISDGNQWARYPVGHDPEVWQHARAVTAYVRSDGPESEPCFTSQREASPNAPAVDIRLYGCSFYPAVRMVFMAVQVAGPRLTPSAIDAGFHAIPRVASDDPYLPACWFDVRDYTCMKDAMITWWDVDGTAPSANQPGCWRMYDEGRRDLATTWPNRDLDADRDPAADLCNYQGPEV